MKTLWKLIYKEDSIIDINIFSKIFILHFLDITILNSIYVPRMPRHVFNFLKIISQDIILNLGHQYMFKNSINVNISSIVEYISTNKNAPEITYIFHVIVSICLNTKLIVRKYPYIILICVLIFTNVSK